MKYASSRIFWIRSYLRGLARIKTAIEIVENEIYEHTAPDFLFVLSTIENNPPALEFLSAWLKDIMHMSSISHYCSAFEEPIIAKSVNKVWWPMR